jgi:hypothetical protein
MTGEVVVAPDSDRYLFKTMMPMLDVEILRRGKPILGEVQAGRAIPQDRQSFRVLGGVAAEATVR